MKRFLRFLLGLSIGTKIIIAVIIVGLGVFVITYFEPHKLFIDEVVDEDFPAPVAIVTTTTTAEPTPDTAPPTTTVPPTTIAPDDPVTTTTVDATEPTIEDPEPGFTPATEEDQDDPPATTVSSSDDDHGAAHHDHHRGGPRGAGVAIHFGVDRPGASRHGHGACLPPARWFPCGPL